MQIQLAVAQKPHDWTVGKQTPEKGPSYKTPRMHGWIPSASNIDGFCSCQFNIQATEILSWSKGSVIIQLFHSSIFLPAAQVNVTIDSKQPEVWYHLTLVQEVRVCHFVAAMLHEAHQAPITILISYDKRSLEQRPLWNTHCFLSSSSKITGLAYASRTVTTMSWWKTSQ